MCGHPYVRLLLWGFGVGCGVLKTIAALGYFKFLGLPHSRALSLQFISEASVPDIPGVGNAKKKLVFYYIQVGFPPPQDLVASNL